MKKTISTIILMLFAAKAMGQQDPLLSQYMFNGLYLNPAYAGSHKYWTSTFSYRNQWVGIEGAPSTAIVAVDGPVVATNVGFGVLAIHDEIGVTRQNSLLLNYAYQIRTSQFTRLALGVNAGISQFSAKLTDLRVWDEDNVFASDITSQVLPRLGIGAYYYGKMHYIGLSLPTLFAYEKDVRFNFDLSRATFLRRHYLLTAGVVLNASKNVKFKPSFLLKYVQNAPMQINMNASMVYKNQYWAGVSYRSGDAVALIFEYQSKSYFRIGYSYDITLSKLRSYSSGSHEILLGIDFGKDLVKVKSPRYF